MKRKGFTLVEVIVSAVIFCTVSFPTAGLMIRAWQYKNYAEGIQRSNLTARSVMEYLKSTDIGKILSVADRGTIALYSLCTEQADVDLNITNYPMYSGDDKYQSDSIRPDEKYEEIEKNFSQAFGDSSFTGILRIILSKDDTGMIFICVTVWDRAGGDMGRTTLSSLRRTL